MARPSPRTAPPLALANELAAFDEVFPVPARNGEGLGLLLGTRVHLDLRVKVLKDWQRDPAAIARLGL